MSKAHYELGGLRFWDENEIELRETVVKRLSGVIKRELININPSFRFFQVECPILTPQLHINSEYDADEVFQTNHKDLALRAETTASSYMMASKIKGRLPICVWQVGKSFRRETNDGATASKLRFNEFYQLEFQCIYPDDTKADYRELMIDPISMELGRLTKTEISTLDSDRLPSYSESTLDLESHYNGKPMELASFSIRNDYPYTPNSKVFEMAFGLDRIVEVALQYS